MAGVANPNLPSFFQDTPRSGEVPGADWVDGVNKGASCSPGIGVNTGDYDPKVTDWSQDERNPQDGQQLGGAPAPITFVQGADINDQAAFVQATGSTAPGGALITGVVNRTGKTVPANSWAWGTKTQA